MNKQQEEEFLAEEKEARQKHIGCLLILGVMAIEAFGVVVGTTYYYAHRNDTKASDPEKIIKHTDSTNKIVFEHTR